MHVVLFYRYENDNGVDLRVTYMKVCKKFDCYNW